MQQTRGNAKGARMAVALASVSKPLEPPYPLAEGLRPVWDEVIARKARSEWHPTDLRFAWELVEVMGRLRVERETLRDEAFVVPTKSGPRINPRLTGIRTLQTQEFELARYLQLHPSFETPQARKLTGNRKANRQALEVVASAKSDPSSRFLAIDA